jgi:glutathione S-transferase
VKLYDNTHAISPRRVRIFLAEKGIEVPRVEVDLLKGEHKQADYRKIAPNSRVPALELDDGTVLLETVAICRHFERLQPDPPLMGVGALDEAVVEMWQRRMEFELMVPMAMTFRHTHPMMAQLEQQFPEFGEAQRSVATKRLQTLDGELADREFIAGDRYTIADITALASIDFFKLAGFEIADAQHHLARWYQSVSSRASASA